MSERLGAQIYNTERSLADDSQTRRVNSVESKKQISIPPVELSILHTYHRTHVDMYPLLKVIKDIDIYIPETVGGGKKALQAYRSVAQGELLPQDALAMMGLVPESDPNFLANYAELKILHNSKVAIGFISPETTDDEDRVAVVPYKGAEFSEMVRNRITRVLTVVHTKAYQEQVRESLERLAFMPSLIEVLEAYPELQAQEKLKVLLYEGINHSPAVQNYVGYVDSIRQIYAHTPVYSFMSVAVMLARENMQIDAELALQVYLEERIWLTMFKELVGLTHDTRRMVQFVKGAVHRFNLDEIATLIEQPKKDLREELNKKGIVIPSSEEDLKLLVQDII